MHYKLDLFDDLHQDHDYFWKETFMKSALKCAIKYESDLAITNFEIQENEISILY